MNSTYRRWQTLFLFSFGVAIAATFCMKWMETDFWVNSERFTIIGLEISYGKQEVMSILQNIDPRVRTILSYHLHFDFAFMMGIYPAITSLCMMTREKLAARRSRIVYFLLALLPFLAWAADIRENIYLLNWLKQPVNTDDFGIYHFIVAFKWLAAIVAAVGGLAGALLTLRKSIVRK